MRPFDRLTGIAVPLLKANIDTDMIIRVEHMTASDQSHLGDHAFETWRIGPDGQENPSFVLNQPRYRSAPILLAGINFGCGSSREHAVGALLGRGIRVVIAPSFGETFYNNCFQQGLLPVRLDLESVKRIACETEEDDDKRDMTVVDLLATSVHSPRGHRYRFEIEARRRDALLKGLDDIEQSLALLNEVETWQNSDRNIRPWLWKLPATGSEAMAAGCSDGPLAPRN